MVFIFVDKIWELVLVEEEGEIEEVDNDFGVVVRDSIVGIGKCS